MRPIHPGRALLLVLLSCSSCVVTQMANNRSCACGTLEPIVYQHPLTPEGSRVAVVDAIPPQCRLIGYVTGRAGILTDAPIEDARAMFSKAPWEGALNNARNLAAANGSTIIKIDARETFEGRYPRFPGAHFPLLGLIYARALWCPPG